MFSKRYDRRPQSSKTTLLDLDRPVAHQLPELGDHVAHVGDVQERALLEADIHKRGLHPRQHPANLAPVDISNQAASPVTFDVTFDQDVTGFDATDVTVGGTAGGIIGNYMDEQAEEMERDLEGATVERVGEGVDDLLPFDHEDFVNALLDIEA